MVKIESTMIDEVYWKDGELTIVFRSGRTYIYSGVSHEVYQGLLTAPSAGSYFHAYIKENYKWKKR